MAWKCSVCRKTFTHHKELVWHECGGRPEAEKVNRKQWRTPKKGEAEKDGP